MQALVFVISFLSYCSLTYCVKQQLAVAVAVMLKRNSLEDDFPHVIDSFVSDVTHLFSLGNLQLVRSTQHIHVCTCRYYV